MKPVCKSEARWLFWRYENFSFTTSSRPGFAKWMKTQMNRARRRYHRAGLRKVKQEYAQGCNK